MKNLRKQIIDSFVLFAITMLILFLFNENYNVKLSMQESNFTPLIEEKRTIDDLKTHVNNEIVEDAFYKAFLKMKVQTKRANSVDTTIPWQNIGPYNLGGRMIGVKVDPNNSNIVWAGAASGGLWKMTITGEGLHD